MYLDILNSNKNDIVKCDTIIWMFNVYYETRGVEKRHDVYESDIPLWMHLKFVYF